jgi:hypothetical protein
MGLRVDFDIDSLIAQLDAVGKDTTKAAQNAMKAGGKDIRDLARDYAPIDDGDLEKAIVTQVDGKTVFVGIDPRAVDEHGRPVVGYATLMHEYQAIGAPGPLPKASGLYGLGKKSVAKDGGRGIVGGKFLERAFNELARKIVANAAFRVKRVFIGVSGGGEE